MSHYKILILLLSATLIAGCSQGTSSNAGTQTQIQDQDDVKVVDKPVRPPVQPATCSTTESFSFAPTLGNSSAPPRDILTKIPGFNGNTWDGRVVLQVGHSDGGILGWYVSAFRPERIGTDTQGYPVFNQDVLSSSVEWLRHEDPPKHLHIGLYPNTKFKENPFRSNANGDADLNGSFETYEVNIIAPVLTDVLQMQLRRGKIVVGNPKTRDAYIALAQWSSDFETLQTINGKMIRGLEPSITFDGQLLLYQGHPKNNGEIGKISYSYNQQNGVATGWSEPRSVSDMYHVDRNVLVGGVPFHERYPIAKQPFRDANGLAFDKGDLYEGAYPWISLDGTELFHTTLVAGCAEDIAGCPQARWGERALRGGFAGIGRWTNYTMRLIDGVANPDRESIGPTTTIRTLTFALSTFGTMWESFLDIPNLPIPYGPRRPAYGFIGNVRGEYTEASFEDAMDSHYVLFLRMNELVARKPPTFFWEKNPENRTLFKTMTPDTSRYLNNGTLAGKAAFPLEYDGRDANVGRSGQAIYFRDTSKVEVKNSPSLNSLQQGLTVEMWVKRVVDISNDAPNRFRYLLRKGKSFDVIAEEDGSIQVSVTVKQADGTTVRRRSDRVGKIEGWTHVGFTWSPTDGKMNVFVAGRLTKELQFPAGEIVTDSSNLIIGPGEQVTPLWGDLNQALFILDDVKVSNVPRTPLEFRYSAFFKGRQTYASLGRALPFGLKESDVKVPTNNQLSNAAVALGEKLFFDPILSKNRDMSCATCHQSNNSFTDGRPRALGFEGKTLRRNTPTIFNRALSTIQFWDGGTTSLEEQALVPILNVEEMNLSLEEAVTRLKADANYRQAFNTAYGQEVTTSGIAKALASFQRTILLGNSRVDQFEHGNRAALNESEIRGRTLFFGKARCVSCHSGSNYTDEAFHFTGFTCTTDFGREEMTGRTSDRRQFKTPTLRGVGATSPYLHDGSLATLEQVVETYNRGGIVVENRDTEIRPLGLSTKERADLVNFLRAL